MSVVIDAEMEAVLTAEMSCYFIAKPDYFAVVCCTDLERASSF